MIEEQKEPVAWYLLMYELIDAQDGIESLLRDMKEDKEFSEIEFGIHMAHIYGHLNRAWNRRNATDKQIDTYPMPEEWNSFPTDSDLPQPF
ncbi:hypothetical protein GCM10023172_05170 [Hymenobacter ginsengisoli]|uniref:Uncharacterized protein n=1 Tax=Hymenobacter ginsengisoli TaxID=1051626 RepID=A0ABP8PZS4_9BACT|nr:MULTISPECIES: hypothetical protein [unclassified Hymenobacter]MBO2030619.1 hypothetical protein [Hymenobacter sp. BT559]